MTWRLAEPWLLLLLALPLVVLWWRARRGGAAFAPYAIAASLRPSRGPLVFRVLIALGLALMTLAVARPQLGRSITERSHDGRDLMLVIDLSGSMRIDDLDDGQGNRVDRLAAVTSAAVRFVERRGDDRLGLVFFGSNAVVSCPPTHDHQTVIEFLRRTEAQQRRLWARDAALLGDGTNLGLGLGHAARAMRAANQLGKAVILVTDGADSKELPNWVDPLAAARSASATGVKVYGIGVGNPHGTMTQRDLFGRVRMGPVPPRLLPDHGRLAAIAGAGRGESYRADDAAGLQTIFDRIDALEPTPRSIRQVDDVTDRWIWPLAAGLALLGLALALEPRLRGTA